MRRQLNPFLRKVGYEIAKYTPSTNGYCRRKQLIQHYQIDLILDVGANVGQFGQGMRRLDYMGHIVSFEPLSSAFLELTKRAQKESLWDAINIALGDFDGSAEINISMDSQSSSLLGILPSHTNRYSSASYSGKESITVKKLDSIFDQYAQAFQSIYLKIDAQGFERKIIEGGVNSLSRINGIQMEVSIIPLYQDECLLPEMLKLMNEAGYTLMSLEPGYSDPKSGQLLQVDCIFFRA
jgi:FkbM family methyltransferase